MGGKEESKINVLSWLCCSIVTTNNSGVAVHNEDIKLVTTSVCFASVFSVYAMNNLILRKQHIPRIQMSLITISASQMQIIPRSKFM